MITNTWLQKLVRGQWPTWRYDKTITWVHNTHFTRDTFDWRYGVVKIYTEIMSMIIINEWHKKVFSYTYISMYTYLKNHIDTFKIYLKYILWHICIYKYIIATHSRLHIDNKLLHFTSFNATKRTTWTKTSNFSIIGLKW